MLKERRKKRGEEGEEREMRDGVRAGRRLQLVTNNKEQEGEREGKKRNKLRFGSP